MELNATQLEHAARILEHLKRTGGNYTQTKIVGALGIPQSYVCWALKYMIEQGDVLLTIKRERIINKKGKGRTINRKYYAAAQQDDMPASSVMEK